MLDVGGSEKLRFQLLGKVLADSEAGPLRISSRKGLALLIYLAMNGGRPVPRTVLADLLWGDRGEAGALQNLRQALLTLRRDLGPPFAALLQVSDQAIALTPHRIDVDVLEFERLARATDIGDRAGCLAIEWGTFLEGFVLNSEAFDDWVVAERHRVATVATRVFAELEDHLTMTGDGAGAIAALERLVRLDPSEEKRHRRLIMLEARYRGPDAALARAKELSAMLRRDLDAAPEAATTELVEDIRREARAGDSAAGLGTPRIVVPNTVVSRTVAPDTAGPVAVIDAPQVVQPRGSMRLPLRFAAFACAVVLLMAGADWWIGRTAVGSLAPADKASFVTSVAPPASSAAVQSPAAAMEAAARERSQGVVPIVVMPFTTYDEAPSIRLIADMVTDDLTHMISRIRFFRVISRQTARSYQERKIDAATIAAELHVRYVFAGSIRRIGDRLRIVVELTDTATRTVSWSESIERAEADRHDVQDEIVKRLARALQIESYRAESSRRSNDSDADALAFKGMETLQGAFSNINLETYNKAEALFSQALERDPDHVFALLGLGSYHVSIGVQRLVPNPDEHVKKAHGIMLEVIRRSPTNSGAYHQLGVILQGSGNLESALEAFERSLEFNPSNAGAYAHKGFVLTRLRRASEGLEHIQYAMRLGPRDPSLSIWLEFAGTTELELNHIKEATEYFQRALALSPAYPRAWAGLMAAQALAGDIDGARRSSEKLKALAPGQSPERLARSFGRFIFPLPQLHRGVRLALALPTDR